ncbi:uncharacterized protein BDV17DRAFT_73314 [Aspergillus undulatus]|uniref:uncharacterized protein n=1 Tax=Aspergillus undulatus TaxID=1810928 RepID=UPI003CCCCE2C
MFFWHFFVPGHTHRNFFASLTFAFLPSFSREIACMLGVSGVHDHWSNVSYGCINCSSFMFSLYVFCPLELLLCLTALGIGYSCIGNFHTSMYVLEPSAPGLSLKFYRWSLWYLHSIHSNLLFYFDNDFE